MKMKNKEYRNVKIFASVLYNYLKNIVKNFKFKTNYVKKIELSI